MWYTLKLHGFGDKTNNRWSYLFGATFVYNMKPRLHCGRLLCRSLLSGLWPAAGAGEAYLRFTLTLTYVGYSED